MFREQPKATPYKPQKSSTAVFFNKFRSKNPQVAIFDKISSAKYDTSQIVDTSPIEFKDLVILSINLNMFSRFGLGYLKQKNLNKSREIQKEKSELLDAYDDLCRSMMWLDRLTDRSLSQNKLTKEQYQFYTYLLDTLKRNLTDEPSTENFRAIRELINSYPEMPKQKGKVALLVAKPLSFTRLFEFQQSSVKQLENLDKAMIKLKGANDMKKLRQSK